MQINSTMSGDITIAKLEGEIDGKTAPLAQAQLSPLVVDGCKLVLEMSGVSYMSSAGLRMLLSLRRQIPANGKLVLAGLSEQLYDVMSITGFLDFFVVCATLEEALAALSSEEVRS
jgi:anti-sigma B factor antagonist